MAFLKKIAIIHYRAGRTDGVSLEMEKRKSILKSMGYEVRVISGPVQTGSDWIIDALEFDTPKIREIKENSFKYFGKKTLGIAELMDRISSVSRQIEEAFWEYQRREKFDVLLIHNIYSHGRHIAAASAFTRIAEKLGVPVVATNHDYYWERIEYQQPAYSEIEAYLKTFVPPDLPNITHVCINSLARKGLWELKGIDSVVFPDIFDFQQPAWVKDEFNADFLEKFGLREDDLIILQGTRIVQRKGIELAVQFVRELTGRKKRLQGHSLYNGKTLSEKSRIVFLLAGYAEESATPYLLKLKDEIEKSGIAARFISDSIGAQRQMAPHKKYSLWDAYVYADLVTYPSLFEGWGNQFIEAVFAKKPVVLFEYPVFKADIKREGYHYVSLGDTTMRPDSNGLVSLESSVLKAAVDETVQLLISSRTNSLLEDNFKIGAKYHSYDVLKKFLEERVCENVQLSHE